MRLKYLITYKYICLGYACPLSFIIDSVNDSSNQIIISPSSGKPLCYWDRFHILGGLSNFGATWVLLEIAGLKLHYTSLYRSVPLALHLMTHKFVLAKEK